MRRVSRLRDVPQKRVSKERCLWAQHLDEKNIVRQKRMNAYLTPVQATRVGKISCVKSESCGV